MKDNFKRNLLISSSVSLFILMISSTASYLSIQNLLSSNSWVNHTQEVISDLNKGNALILDAQSGMRGFLITGNETFIDDLDDIEKESNDYFDKL